MNLQIIDSELSRTIFFRAEIAWIIGAVFLIGHEYFFGRFLKGRPLPLLYGVIILLAYVLSKISAMAIGGAAFMILANKYADPASFLRYVIFYFGVLFGAWCSSILLQLGQNYVRYTLGLPLIPIRFIRKDAFSFGRNKKSSKK